jgi:hypothetical protein
MQTANNPAPYPVHINSSFLMIKWPMNGNLADANITDAMDIY